MNKFTIRWKELARKKAIFNYHVVQRAILKTIFAKGENKIEILKGLLSKAFSPNRNGEYHGLCAAIRMTTWYYKYHKCVLDNMTLDELSETENALFSTLLNSLSIPNPQEHYSYIFVRQDISPEQQLVQSAHATCVLGSKTTVDPNVLNFVVIGLEDLEALLEVEKFAKRHNFTPICFTEPDIGDGEMTAFATMPVRADMRKAMKKFKLLKFK